MTVFDLQIEPASSNMISVSEFIEKSLLSEQVPVKIIQKILICADEIYTNIVQYADAKMTEIHCMVANTLVTVEFADDGKPYNPLENPDPDITLSAEARRIGGYGIHIVKKLMDQVDYRYTDGKNILSFRISVPAAQV